MLAAAVGAAAVPASARASSDCIDATASLCKPEVTVPLDTATDGSTPAYSGGSQVFTLGGSWTSIDPGRFNNALFFNANGTGMTFPPLGPGANRDHITPASLTVSSWVSGAPPDLHATPAAFSSIVERGTTSCEVYSGAWGLVTGISGGPVFYVNLANSHGGVTRVETPEVDPAQIWDGTFHALAGVFDGGRSGSRRVVSLWIDGRQAAARDLPSDLSDPNGTLVYPSSGGFNDELSVARSSDGLDQNCPDHSPRAFKGSVDEVELFHVPLDATQLATLQSAGPASPPDVPYVPQIQGPLMTGTPKVGQQLTCTDRDGLNAPNNSPSNSPPTFTWERAPRDTHFENDANWTAIAGASGSHYTVQNADAGSRVRCHEYGSDVTDAAGAGYWNVDRASNSLRADVEAPVNTVAPFITGTGKFAKFGPYHIVPRAGSTLTCNPGTWENGPEESAGDFTYQWLRNGLAIQGAVGTQKTYTLTHTYDFQGNLVDPHGDAGKDISCLVYAKNDVGGAAPVVSSNDVRAVDGAPHNVSRPSIKVVNSADGNPLHRYLECSTGSWRDAYADYGIAPYKYQFEWFRSRSGMREYIPGSVENLSAGEASRYHVTAEDLGRNLTCSVRTANPIGSSRVFAFKSRRVPLPTGPVDSQLYRDGGRNGADPTNLLPISNDYKNAIDDLLLGRLHDGVKAATDGCKDGSALPKDTRIPGGVPANSDVNYRVPLSPIQRCQILLHDPDKLEFLKVGGVRWTGYHGGECKAIEDELGAKVTGRGLRCPALGIEVPSIDPSHPPTSDADIKALLHVTPKTVIWDMNGDGITDAICPATAPVLRTIYDPGTWNPRAIIVTADGSFHFAGGRPQDEFNTSTQDNPGKGHLRPNQVRVCATSFDPPPDPNHGPCVTDGTIGRLNITGNLCPIDVRQLDARDWEDLLGKGDKFKQLRDFLFAASEDRLRHEGVVTSRNVHRPGPIVWADWGHGAHVSKTTLSKASLNLKAATSAYENTAAAMSSWQSPYGFTPPDGTPHVDSVNNLVDNSKQFALDQLYVTRDPVALNGVTQDPLGGNAALLVPSDVKEALPDTHSMVMASRDAASHLGLPNTDGIPLSTGGEFVNQLSDVPKSPSDILRSTNLHQMQDDLQNQFDDLKRQGKDAAAQKIKELLDNIKSKLDLGPFNLDGDATVHTNDDGTATIEVSAKLPLLNNLSVDHVLIHADQSGHLALRNLHFHADGANLGALALKDIDLAYNSDAGLNVAGKILVGGGGVVIKRFQIDAHGNFQALDVDYVPPPPGISLSSGVFLALIGGGLDLPQSLIDAHAVISVGPATGGGCATVGIDGRLNLHFADPIVFESTADLQVVCIPLAHMVFHADTGGLVFAHGDVNLDLGPIYARAFFGLDVNLNGFHCCDSLPPFQVTASGDGGIRDLLSGKVKAVLSNHGIAGCGSIEAEVPLVGEFIGLFTGKPKKLKITIAGGASLDFSPPPVDYTTIIHNLHLFFGCDIDTSFFPLGKPPGFRVAANTFPFQVPKKLGASAFSIEGAGGAPRVKLRDPKGHVYDFTHAVSKGKSIGNGIWGKVLRSADKTVVLVGNPLPGTWTAILAPGSPRIVRVRAARLIPHAHVTGSVTGHGLKRTLNYNVEPISGQVVRFVEFVKGGQKLIKTVRTGGHGHVNFTPAESTGTHRTIVAQVEQGGLPRDGITVARYVSAGPKVGRARHIRIRRRGHKAIVTWDSAPLGASYQVGVRSGDGRNVLLFPKRGKRRVVVTRLGKKEGLRITIVAFSPRGHRGPTAFATLNGNMQLGRVKHLPPLKKKHKKRH